MCNNKIVSGKADWRSSDRIQYVRKSETSHSTYHSTHSVTSLSDRENTTFIMSSMRVALKRSMEECNLQSAGPSDRSNRRPDNSFFSNDDIIGTVECNCICCRIPHRHAC